MSEKITTGVPFEGDDQEKRELWDSLQEIPQPEPPPRMRRKFYGELDKLGKQSRLAPWRQWFGLAGARGFATAVACLIAGIAVGVVLKRGEVERVELANLQAQVTALNRNLILDRLENGSASKRLLGVLDAAGVAQQDPEIARALLSRAVDDRVYSVRAAAIDAIGPRLSTPAVGHEIMGLLQKSESPIVQLALVDLILRHGDNQQIEELLQLSEHGALHPELVQYVKSAVWRDRT
ncbi:MAG: hypothetical protein ACJ8MH_00915 [Povalibacter sp.]